MAAQTLKRILLWEATIPEEQLLNSAQSTCIKKQNIILEITARATQHDCKPYEKVKVKMINLLFLLCFRHFSITALQMCGAFLCCRSRGLIAGRLLE